MENEKIKLLIVDDSFLIRNIIADLLKNESDIQIIGSAANGNEAVKKIVDLKPDVVTMDYRMPELDGLGAIDAVMKGSGHKPAIIMVSAITADGAEETLRCLRHGAVDFVQKPSGELSLDIQDVQGELIRKIRIAYHAFIEHRKSRFVEENIVKKISHLHPIEAVVIGASTGGPPVVEQIVKSLPNGINAAVFVVQHMPKEFTGSLAARLNNLSQITVKEATDGEEVEDGQCYVAPGDWHMMIEKNSVGRKIIRLGNQPQRNGFRPSIDYTMISAAGVYGEKAMGVILTGMGNDGSGGMLEVKKAKGRTIVQSPETALISSMPRAAIDINAVEEILPVTEIVKKIILLTT